MYFFGEGVAQNYAEAVNWFRLAADQGRADAQYALGWMYFNGWGVTQDYILALMWFDLSATRGHQIAVSARDHAAKQMTPTQITEAQKRARDWKPKPHREIVDINIYPWSSIGKIGVTSATVANACSGTVIGSNEFLTAAHCLYNSMTKRFFPPDRYIFCLAIPEVNIACTELLRGTQSRQHSTLRSTAIGQTWKSY